VIATRLARVPPFERGITLGDFLVPIRLGERAASWQRHLLMIVVGAGLIALCARVSFYLPGNPLVPVTLQTFGVLFIGALLGYKRSIAAVGLYLLIGIVGVPVFAYDQATGSYLGGAGSIASVRDGALVLGARGGYLVGFLFAAAVVGRLAELGWDRRIGGSLAAMLIGNGLVYAVGVPWLMFAVGLAPGRAIELGLLPFVLGDALKLAVAAGLLPVGWWLVRRRSNDL
jgi:biotin transport system substrate-specific component